MAACMAIQIARQREFARSSCPGPGGHPTPAQLRDVDAVEEERHEVELIQAASQLRRELHARRGHTRARGNGRSLAVTFDRRGKVRRKSTVDSPNANETPSPRRSAGPRGVLRWREGPSVPGPPGRPPPGSGGSSRLD
jgi:hypothetical protein